MHVGARLPAASMVMRAGVDLEVAYARRDDLSCPGVSSGDL